MEFASWAPCRLYMRSFPARRLCDFMETSWQLFEQFQEVFSRPHYKARTRSPPPPSTLFRRAPICLYARTDATERGARPPNDLGPTVTSPTVATIAVIALGDFSAARRGRPCEVRHACEKSNRRTRVGVHAPRAPQAPPTAAADASEVL